MPNKLLSVFGYVTNADVLFRYFDRKGKGYDGANFALGMGEYVGRVGLLGVESMALNMYASGDQKQANVVAGVVVSAEVGKLLLRYLVNKGYGKVGKK